jgi:hypothetical protein
MILFNQPGYYIVPGMKGLEGSTGLEAVAHGVIEDPTGDFLLQLHIVVSFLILLTCRCHKMALALTSPHAATNAIGLNGMTPMHRATTINNHNCINNLTICYVVGHNIKDIYRGAAVAARPVYTSAYADCMRSAYTFYTTGPSRT